MSWKKEERDAAEQKGVLGLGKQAYEEDNIADRAAMNRPRVPQIRIKKMQHFSIILSLRTSCFLLYSLPSLAKANAFRTSHVCHSLLHSPSHPYIFAFTSSAFPFAVPLNSLAFPFASPAISDAFPFASPAIPDAFPFASPVISFADPAASLEPIPTEDLIAWEACSVVRVSLWLSCYGASGGNVGSNGG